MIFAIPFLKTQTSSVNTTACCHRIHSWIWRKSRRYLWTRLKFKHQNTITCHSRTHSRHLTKTPTQILRANNALSWRCNFQAWKWKVKAVSDLIFAFHEHLNSSLLYGNANIRYGHYYLLPYTPFLKNQMQTLRVKVSLPVKFSCTLNIQTRKTRQGNLSSSMKTEDKERAELLGRKRALKAELMTTSTAIGHIEHDMGRLQTYIINSGTVNSLLNEPCVERDLVFYDISRNSKNLICV